MNRLTKLCCIAAVFSFLLGPVPLTGDPVRFGTLVNSGFGTNGFTTIASAAALAGPYAFGLQAGWANQIVDICGTADWLPAGGPVSGTPLNWFAGPGLYGGWAHYAQDPGYRSFGLGLRGVLGVRTDLFPSVEVFGSVVPAVGYRYLGNISNLMWNADLELGVRFQLSPDPGTLKPQVPIHPELLLRTSTDELAGVVPGDTLVRSFSLTPGPLDQADSWTFAITGDHGTPLRSWKGSGTPPRAFDWDGLTDLGLPAPGGPGRAAVSVTYNDGQTDLGLPAPGGPGRAAVSVTYNDGQTGRAETPFVIAPQLFPSRTGPESPTTVVLLPAPPLVPAASEVIPVLSAPSDLDTGLPTVQAVLPEGFLFTPDGEGEGSRFALPVSAASRRSLVSWSFDILEPNGKLFFHQEGAGTVPGVLPWDGRGFGDELVQSDQKYGYRVKVTDTLGKTGEALGTVQTGFLLVKTPYGFKLGLANLIFKPNEAELLSDNSPAGRQNAVILGKVLVILKQHAQLTIHIVGHAVNVSGTAKEEDELSVLSQARAEAVKASLARLGLDVRGILTQGKGGTEPLVPHSDKVNNWKNRRVEFLLTEN